MKRYALLFAVVMLAVLAQVAEAGTFIVDRVWYADGPQSTTRINKRVGSSAIYQGTVDLNDNHWAIQATLIVDGTRYDGSPKQQSGVVASQRITCEDNQCGGAHEFDRCPEKTYGGYGIAAIYHNFTPETHKLDLPAGGSGCQEKPTQEGTNESPPGDGTQCTSNECDQSPIIIDLERGGFRLTDVPGGVVFDLIPGGDIERVSWTESGGGDGFLALDRNGNGVINDGAELFGNWTPQPTSAEPNGFLALAVFDQSQHGGDGDGWITKRDQVFDDLRLWVDGDHDGQSAPGELVPLALAAVEAIEVAYVESRRLDQHGNQFRYSSRVRLNGATTKAVDVFLLID